MVFTYLDKGQKKNQHLMSEAWGRGCRKAVVQRVLVESWQEPQADLHAVAYTEALQEYRKLK